MSRTHTFFVRQHELLLGLLGWGAGSVVVGAGLSVQRSEVLRQIGLQAIGWGAIDALLAWSGRRSARQKMALVATTTVSEDEISAARGFQRLVAINAALDVLYIGGGLRLSRSASQKQRGVGLGIAVQGLFLLIYDTLLVWWSTRWRAAHDREGSRPGTDPSTRG